MEYWRDGIVGRSRKFAIGLIYVCACLMPFLAHAQTK